MRFICVLLGLLTGKKSVRCRGCCHLDEDGKCYGHKMDAATLSKNISCGFWKKK